MNTPVVMGRQDIGHMNGLKKCHQQEERNLKHADGQNHTNALRAVTTTSATDLGLDVFSSGTLPNEKE